MGKIELKNFYWDEEAVKLANINSMLVDSNTTLASAEFDINGKTEEISIEVRGEVQVLFEGEYFYNPSEFPRELKNLIKSNKWWDTDERVNVFNNNWVELFYTKDGYWESTYDVLDGIIGETEKEIREFLEESIETIYWE